MPLLSVTTNVKPGPLPADELLGQLSAAVAGLLGKPETYVMVSLQHNPQMLFGGSSEPLAYLELKSIGLPGDDTTRLSAALCEQVGKALDIPASRIYIEFADAQRHLWGWDGRTFAR